VISSNNSNLRANGYVISNFDTASIIDMASLIYYASAYLKILAIAKLAAQ
jgi:hypothetical protein